MTVDLGSSFGPMPALWALAALFLLAGTAMIGGQQLREPVLMLAPVLLGAAAVVSTRWMLGLMAVAVVCVSALMHQHSAGQAEADLAALWGQWWMLMASQLLALAAGWGIGQLIERRLRLMARRMAQEAPPASPLPEIPVALLIHREGVVQEANWAAARLLGHATREAAIGHRLQFEAQAPNRSDDRADHRADDREGLQHLRTPQGRLLAVVRTQQWIRHGGLPAEMVVLHDEQPRQDAEESTRAARGTLSALIEGHPCAMLLSDLQTTRVLLANRAFGEAVGLPVSDIKGMTIRALGIWADDRQRQRIMDTVRAGARTLDDVITIRYRDGRTRQFQARMSRIRIEDRPAMLTVAYDITDEQRQRRELEAVLHHAPVAMLLVRDGRIQWASEAAAHLLGTSVAALVGQAAAPHLGGRKALSDLAAAARQSLQGPAGAALSSVRRVAGCLEEPITVRLHGQALDIPGATGLTSLWTLEALQPDPPAASTAPNPPLETWDPAAA